MAEMSTFLDNWYQIHQKRAEQKRRPTKDEPNFGIFDFLGVGELTLSVIFQWMLDPLQSHMQGTVFLEKFLDQVEKSEHALAFKRDKLADVIAEIEYHTEGKRRIDIVLYNSDFIIGIENKVWATDQVNQCDDYLVTLNERGHGRQVCLIYLTPKGVEPHKRSFSSIGSRILNFDVSFQFCSYAEHIIPWLDNCLMMSLPNSIRAFIQILKAKIRNEIFDGDRLNQLSETVSEIIRESENLVSDINLRTSPERVIELLWPDFIKKTNFDIASWSWGSLTIDESTEISPVQLRIKDEERSEEYGFNIGFCFFFLTGNKFSGLSFGIWATQYRENGKEDLALRLAKELRKEYPWRNFDSNTAYDNNFLVYHKFGKKHKDFFGHNWSDKSEPWIDIAEGLMKQKIRGLAKRSLDHLGIVYDRIMLSDSQPVKRTGAILSRNTE